MITGQSAKACDMIFKNNITALYFILGSIQALAQQHAAFDHKVEVLPVTDSLKYLGFEFSQGKMYVLADMIYSGKKNYLLVMDENGRLQKSVRIPGNYSSIYRSCNNSVFIGNKDSVYQVVSKGDTVWFNYPMSVRAFEAAMVNCFFQADGVVFSREEYPDEMSTRVYASYKDEHQKTVKAVVFESKDTMAVERYEYNRRFKNTKPAASFNDGEKHARFTRKNEKPVRREKERKQTTPNLSQTTPSRYHSAVRMDMNFSHNMFYIMDYTNGCIAQINRELSERKIVDLENFADGNTAFKTVFNDEATGDFYAFEKPGRDLLLRKYDKTDGRNVFSWVFQDYPYAENIRVNGSKIYFIRKGDAERIGNKIYMVDLR